MSRSLKCACVQVGCYLLGCRCSAPCSFKERDKGRSLTLPCFWHHFCISWFLRNVWVALKIRMGKMIRKVWKKKVVSRKKAKRQWWAAKCLIMGSGEEICIIVSYKRAYCSTLLNREYAAIWNSEQGTMSSLVLPEHGICIWLLLFKIFCNLTWL